MSVKKKYGSATCDSNDSNEDRSSVDEFDLSEGGSAEFAGKSSQESCLMTIRASKLEGEQSDPPIKCSISVGEDDCGACQPQSLASNDPFAKFCRKTEAADYTIFSASVASNTANEDRIFIDPSGLFCIFDGHGGSECSSFASEKISQEFLKHYSKKKSQPIDDIACLFFSSVSKEARKGEDGSHLNAAGQSCKNNEPGKALKKTFLAIDSEFLDLHGKKNPTTGSCALACYIEAGAVWSAVVGDSR
jgi:hypothetical protein